jgi:hypothetical protein
MPSLMRRDKNKQQGFLDGYSSCLQKQTRTDQPEASHAWNISSDQSRLL